MEQIEQLKAMRDAAQARVAATPDYKLLTSLTALITELEAVFGMTQPVAPPVVEKPVAGARAQIVPDVKDEAEEPAAPSGNGAGEAAAGGIFGNGSDHEMAVQAAVNAEEEALDQAVADLEAELFSAGVTSSARGPGSKP